jgi:hypothetical protein
MSVDTLNKHVLQMLTHLTKYPIPDPQMVRDFNWFIQKYNLSVQSGEVTAPGQVPCGACDSCCPAQNESGITVTETVLTFNGSTLSTIGTGASGFEISPTTTANKRLYGLVIEITGATTQDFSIYNSLTELSTSLSNGTPNIIGTTLADNDPVPEEAIEAILTISSDSNESANDLSTITVTVKLYTA